jgi:protein-tyrosine phosphatase
MVTIFDLVIVMESGHKAAVERMAPSMRGRVQLLGRFGNFEIPDPYRGPREGFERCLALIELGVESYVQAFWR